ncbi:MAG: hypothetical protein M1821_005357 [Bathelium mastoideum]|nr:MAG: hypothetical protein M1821_005357 [Bathelium mastoideum]
MEGPPPGIDLTESQQPSIYGTIITLWLLSTTVTGLRFLARRITHLPLWWDDWFMLLGCVSTSAISLSTVAYVVPHGLGKHVWAVPPDATYVWAKGLFMQFFFYFTAIAAVKASLLYLYWRLFKYSQIRPLVWILAVIVACWYIAATLVGIFLCKPVSGFWERYSPTNPTHPDCSINSNEYFDGNAIPNIITDAAILILPLPFIWNLQLRRSQKVALTGIFALGIFVIIISILRLIWVARLDLASPDITWNFIPSETWSSVEPNIAVLCGNLPVLKPILNLILGSVGVKHHITEPTLPSHSNQPGSSTTKSRQFLSSKTSNLSFAASGIGSPRYGKELDDLEEDCNHLFDHMSDKREEHLGGKMTTEHNGMGAGFSETKVQGRPGLKWGKHKNQDVELGQLKGTSGKVLVTTDVSVTEVREDRSGSNVSL